MDERVLFFRLPALRILTLALVACRPVGTAPPQPPAGTSRTSTDATASNDAGASTNAASTRAIQTTGAAEAGPPPIVDAEPLVVVLDYVHWPAPDESFPRFVLYADGNVVWREPTGSPTWRWYAARVDGAQVTALHGAIESATRDLPGFVPCTESDPHNDRTELFVKSGRGLRAHIVESPAACRDADAPADPNAAPAMPRGFSRALSAITEFLPTTRRAWHRVDDVPFPGHAKLGAAFDAMWERDQADTEVECRDSARALLSCVQHRKDRSRKAELCAELAHEAAAAESCRIVAILDDVCRPSYERGCPVLVR